MANLNHQIIPARFLLTMGHFISISLVSYTLENNINASLRSPSPAAEKQATSEIEAAITFALCCFVFDFIGIFTGSSLFMNKVNLLQIMAHFIGGVAISTFIHEAWEYEYLWPLVLAFNASTAFVEFAVLFSTHVLKIVVY